MILAASVGRILLTLGMVISIAGGCSEPTRPTPGGFVPPTPVVPENTAPTVLTVPRWDVWVPLPANSSVLDGHAQGTNIESYSWKKVSGPASYSIESPDSLKTKVVDLEEGTYRFELTVTDRGGLSGTATAGVVVYEPRTPGANEFVFKNLHNLCECDAWFADWLYYVIEDFHDYVPAGTAINVFFKAAGSTQWVEILDAGGEHYSYGINSNRFDLVINAFLLADPLVPVDVMITF